MAPEQRVAPGTSRVEALRAADPQRGLLPWTIRVSRSETGLQCSTVGQVEGGAFGLVGLDGQFREVPESNADACGQPDTLLGTRIFAAKRSRDVRTVLYGVAGPDLERVTVALAGGEPRTVPHAPDGAFVFVLRRYPEDARPTVTLRMKDGTTRRHTFPSADGFVVADPFGGPRLAADLVRLRRLGAARQAAAQAAAPAEGVRELRHGALGPGRAERQLAAGVRAPAGPRRGQARRRVLRHPAPQRPRTVTQLHGRQLERASPARRGLGRGARP